MNESPDHLARWLQKEKTKVSREREDNLVGCLGSFRVGSPPYLNTAPLVRGLEKEIIFAHPSELAGMLQRDELDAALVSVTEPLLHDRYEILDGIAIASLGEVKSILLAHRRPLEEMREVYCDTASLASYNLLRVLLAEKGFKPEYKPLTNYDPATIPDFALLIGDQALDFIHAPHDHAIWDLGAEWYEMTGLPCVHAVWALRRDIDNKALRFILREAKDFGLETLDYIINSRKEYTLEFRKDYLGWHIHFHMCADEKKGIVRLAELMHKHGLGPVYEPRYVQ
jgi:chorismate dehydratase